MARLLRFIALLAVLLPGQVAAGQATATLRVTLKVVASCRVQTQPLVFATYTSGGPAVGTASSGSIDVTCAHGTPVAVYLDSEHTLTGPDGAHVVYTLQANGHPWPVGEPIHLQGQGPQTVHLGLTGSVPAGQRIPSGDYEDQAVVRVVY